MGPDLMRWDLDPDLALQTRLSFGRHAVLVAALVMAGMALALLTTGAPKQFVVAMIAGITLGALVIALPFAAIHILTLDRSGRLDQQRLSGRSDAWLATVLLGGSSWLLLLCGLPVLFLSQSLRLSAVQVLALVIGAAAVANALLSVRRLLEADKLVLAVFAVSFTVLSSLAVFRLPWATPVALLGGAILWSASVPLVLRRMRRPPVAVRRRAGNLLRPLVRMRTTRLPEFTRAILSTWNTIWMLLICLAMPLLMLLAQTRLKSPDRDATAALLIYVPLIIGALDASNRMRKERTVRSIERIVLSGQDRWAVIWQLAAGYGLPFVMISLAAALALVWLRPADVRVLAPWPAVAVVMVFVGLAEALRDRRISVYVVPAAFAMLLAANGYHGRTTWVVLGLCWIPLVMAAQSLDRPDDPPLRGWQAPLAASALGAAAASLMHDTGNSYFVRSTPFVAAWMSLAAGLLLPDHAPLRNPRLLLAASLGCGLAAGLTAYYAIDPRMLGDLWTTPWFSRMLWPSTFSLLIGGLAAAGLSFGWLAHNRFGSTHPGSVLVRMIPILAAVALDSATSPGRMHYPISPVSGQLFVAFRLETQLAFLVVLTVAIAVLLFLDLSGRHARHRS